MGVTMGELKELSSDGKITADVIKRAMFERADDIEKRFNKIPKSFCDLKTELTNTLILGLQGPMKKFNNFINTDSFQRFFNSLTNGIMVFSHFLGVALDIGISGFNLLANSINIVVRVYSNTHHLAMFFSSCFTTFLISLPSSSVK